MKLDGRAKWVMVAVVLVGLVVVCFIWFNRPVAAQQAAGEEMTPEKMQEMMQAAMGPMMQMMGPIMQIMAPVAVSTTDQDVYVVRAGKVYHFSKDLRLLNTAELPAAPIPMPPMPVPRPPGE